MSDETQKDIEEMVCILKSLDKQSLLILHSGAQMLKARQQMDETKEVVDSARELQV